MYLFKNISLISMCDGADIKSNMEANMEPNMEANMDVLVQDGLIAEIGQAIKAEGAEIIEGKGYYLMPSLFDAHAHLNSSEMCNLFIANGITSIRHLSGGDKAMSYAKAIETGCVIGPSVYASGPIYDGSDALDKKSAYRYIDSIESAEKAVIDTVSAGYRWVKTYPSIKPEHLKALMAKANEMDIKVCGHMSYTVDSKMLCDWGYHCCEHSSSLPNEPQSIQYLAEAGMWFCPTQVVCETLPDYVWAGKKLEDLKYYEYVPDVIRQFWETKNQEIIRGYKKRGMKPDIHVVIERGKTFMKYSDKVMAGSDTMYPGIIAGFSLHDELEKLVELYGQTPYEVLKMATVNPARYIGLADHKGGIQVGYDADLLLLRENPLTAISNTRQIEGVMKKGQYFDRKKLDILLRSAKEEPVAFFEPLF
ncbi:amidohydrolase family protein [Fusibacter sp. 3D3]|uniref:amidohydrolase family protein n=1 Tax=Fusibacter sp. 3D3 TaxID=1048380 RepID=UPI000852CF43|nr:amidohydrolase family protein [Fusibacter sp. 3D3]GAU79790.1 amidohydrolase precursor [Fusibacter sp. 3D3]